MHQSTQLQPVPLAVSPRARTLGATAFAAARALRAATALPVLRVALCLVAAALPAACGDAHPGEPPATIERAYGDAQHGVAGEALRYPLVVRVLDGSGRPLTGVTVEWQAASRATGAARFDTRTDRYGYARAIWILASRSGPQTASATVRGLPTVPFMAQAEPGPRGSGGAPASGGPGTPGGNEPGAGARYRSPGRPSTPAGFSAPGGSGDAGRFAAPGNLRGSGGAAVAGEPLDHGAAGPVEPGVPGPAARVPAPPLRVAGHVVPANGDATTGLEALAEDARGSALAVAPVDRQGRFALSLPREVVDSTVLVVEDLMDPGGGRYFPAVVPLRGEASSTPADSTPAEVGIVLVPRRWRIQSGSYVGREITIDLDAAFRGPCRGCAGFYSGTGAAADGETGPAGRSERGPVRSWPDTLFPLRVVLDRPESVEPLEAADSIAFWRAAVALETVLGDTLFRATAPGANGTPPAGPAVLVRLDPGQAEVGLSMTAAREGEILAGTISFRRAGVLFGPEAVHVIQHELMHALGLGHTCEWRSLLADTERCPNRYSAGATAEDVAYEELLARVKALERSEKAGHGLRAARRGARREAGVATAAASRTGGVTNPTGSR